MLSTPPSPGSPCTRPGRHVGTNPVCISVGFTCLQCIYTWRPKGRFSSLPLPDFPGSSALLGFHHRAKSGAAALAEYSCAGGVRLRWRCMAVLRCTAVSAFWLSRGEEEGGESYSISPL